MDGAANTAALERDAAFRARYDWIILWPAADRIGTPSDAALAESLATDTRFARHPGTDPLIVYERRAR
jgi:hypothetical protein